MNVNFYELRRNEHRIPTLSCVRETTVTDEIRLSNPALIARTIREAFQTDDLPEEYLWMVACDSKMHCTAIFEISHGTANQSLITPSGVMQRAMLAGAVQIAIVHNHPSGDPEPSSEDIQVTRRIYEAGRICGVMLVDHIIIGTEHRYTSMYEEGYFDDFRQ